MPLIRSESMFSSAMVILSSSCAGRGLWWNGKTRAVVKGKTTRAHRGIFIMGWPVYGDGEGINGVCCCSLCCVAGISLFSI